MEKLKLDLLEEGIKRVDNIVQQIQDQRVIPIIGVTGSGKSTFINYLLGYRVSKKDNKLVMSPQTDDEREPRYAQMATVIGKSTTSYPECFHNPKEDAVYLDTAGFFDTRGGETEIIAKVETTASLRNAREIKGCILVVDINIESDHAALFKRILQNIVRLFNNVKALKDNIMLVMTSKKRNIDVGEVTSSLEGLTEAWDDKEDLSLTKIVEFILKTPKHIIILDI